MSGTSTVRVMSWNVNGRIGRLDEQFQAICSRNPDIVALQEITLKTLEVFHKKFSQVGLNYVANSFDYISKESVLIGRRHYGVLIASRWPLRRLHSFPIPWRERALSVFVHSICGKIEFHTTHIPCGSLKPAEIKIETLNGIYKRLAKNPKHPRIFCGDLNTPQAEKSNGDVVTWGQHERGNEIITDDPRWDQGERSVLIGLASFDLSDVFRTLYGYQHSGFSWFVKRNGHVIRRRRFDHVFASSSLNPIKCQYINEFCKQGLSDHSPIEVIFRPIK